MKNKLIFLLNSIKQSVINKPIVFVLLIIIFFAMTCCCSLPSRFATTEFIDEYSKDASSSYSIKPKKFIENRFAIVDYFLDKEKEINHNGRMGWAMSIDQFNCDIKINGNNKNFDDIFVMFTKFKQEDIAGKENICCIGESEAKECGIVEGDILQLFGIDFVVSKIYVGTSGFWIPYNTVTLIQNWYSFESLPERFTGKIRKSRAGVYVSGISHKDMGAINAKMRKFGCKRDNTDMVGITQSFIVVLAMLMIGIVASTTILCYWLKCNNKKYATYKTLGCRPTMLAMTMIIEIMLIALFAIGLGLIVDFILSITMQETLIIAGYEWLHYLMLIGGPFISILIVTIIAVCKRAIAMPADTKHNG